MMSRLALLMSCLCWTVLPAHAGNWHLIDSGTGTALYFEGHIVEGDAANLVRTYAAAPGITTLILNSPGGSLAEGIRLAQTIEQLSLNTLILKGRQCESACAMAFMGGKSRMAESGATLGIHAPYRPSDAAPLSFLNAEGMVEREITNVDVRRMVTALAERNRIDKRFVDMMFQYDDPGSTKEIGVEEGRALGVFDFVFE